MLTYKMEEDVVKDLFKGKYNRDQILKVLSSLEKDNTRMVTLFSKYHPEYVYSSFKGPQVAKFRIIKELDLNVKTK